jgi:hypothetical protein
VIGAMKELLGAGVEGALGGDARFNDQGIGQQIGREAATGAPFQEHARLQQGFDQPRGLRRLNLMLALQVVAHYWLFCIRLALDFRLLQSQLALVGLQGLLAL